MPPTRDSRDLRDQAKIVTRDIHRYGDDLTVAEAIARLRGGGPVTVTVTDPAPPGGDPARQPAPRLRHHHQPGRRHLPAGTAGNRPGWHRLLRPAGTALFAEALALAGQLADRTAAPAPRQMQQKKRHTLR